MRLIIRGGIAVILLALIFWIVTGWANLVSVPAILPAYLAKERCSCRFVMKQGQSYCESYASSWVPFASVDVDEAAKRVEASVLGVGRVARYMSQRNGCRLDDR
jgi:hypothetical protein